MKALVIGNADYDPYSIKDSYNPWARNPHTLQNPINDARLVSKTLSKLGFNSTLKFDLTRKRFLDTINAFRESFRDKQSDRDKVDVVVFYYAGHGFQIKDENYLVPIDAKNISDWQRLRDASIDLDTILKDIGSHADTFIVILDACRNNPFARSFGSTNLLKGLALIKRTGGTFVVFSTQPGNIAFDGAKGSENSPFANAFVAHIEQPYRSISDALMLVRAKVFEDTKGAQIPWEQSDLFQPFTFRRPGNVPGGTKLTDREKLLERERLEGEYFGYCVVSRNVNLLKSFIKQYPESKYNTQADNLIKEIKLERLYTYIRRFFYIISGFLFLFAAYVANQLSAFYVEANVDAPTGDYKIVQPFSFLHHYGCQLICAVDSRCKAYSFDSASSLCYLKETFYHISENPTSTGKPRVYLGVKAGKDLVNEIKRIQRPIYEEFLTDYIGHEKFETTEKLVGPIKFTEYASCANFCKNLPDCNGFIIRQIEDGKIKLRECEMYRKLEKPLVPCLLADNSFDPETCVMGISGRKRRSIRSETQ